MHLFWHSHFSWPGWGLFCSLFFVPLRPVTALLIIDSYALFFMGLSVAASFVVALLAYGYLAAP